MIIHYTVPEMWHDTDVIVIFILGYTFLFYPSISLKNQTLNKMKKMPGDIIFYTNVPKIINHMLYCSWDTGLLFALPLA